jgi:hypothetical protein
MLALAMNQESVMHGRTGFALLAAAISILSASEAAAESSVATAAEIENAAAEVRKSGGAAGPLSRRLAGRRFQYTLAPRKRGPKNEICTGYPSWGWYPEQRLFELNASADGHDIEFFLDPAGRPAVPAHIRRWLELVAVSCRYTREPERLVLNMYGETVAHEPTRQEVIAIARPVGEEVDMGGFKVTTDEASARRLGGLMVVRISGIIGQWERDRTIVCGADNYSALDVPVLVGDFSACLVNGRVDRVEYVDSLTGEVRRDVRVKARRRSAR